MTVRTTYKVKSLNDLADFLMERAQEIRESPIGHRLVDKARVEERAAAYEECANIVRNTELEPSS